MSTCRLEQVVEKLQDTLRILLHGQQQQQRSLDLMPPEQQPEEDAPPSPWHFQAARDDDDSLMINLNYGLVVSALGLASAFVMAVACLLQRVWAARRKADEERWHYVRNHAILVVLSGAALCVAVGCLLPSIMAKRRGVVDAAAALPPREAAPPRSSQRSKKFLAGFLIGVLGAVCFL